MSPTSCRIPAGGAGRSASVPARPRGRQGRRLRLLQPPGRGLGPARREPGTGGGSSPSLPGDRLALPPHGQHQPLAVRHRPRRPPSGNARPGFSSSLHRPPALATRTPSRGPSPSSLCLLTWSEGLGSSGLCDWCLSPASPWVKAGGGFYHEALGDAGDGVRPGQPPPPKNCTAQSEGTPHPQGPTWKSWPQTPTGHMPRDLSSSESPLASRLLMGTAALRCLLLGWQEGHGSCDFPLSLADSCVHRHDGFSLLGFSSLWTGITRRGNRSQERRLSGGRVSSVGGGTRSLDLVLSRECEVRRQLRSDPLRLQVAWTAMPGATQFP